MRRYTPPDTDSTPGTAVLAKNAAVASQSNGGANGSRIVSPPSAASRSARRRRSRRSRGGARNTSRIWRLNWRRLVKPDANATSARVRSVSSSSRRAKCARRDRASWSGVMPELAGEDPPQVPR